MSENGGNYLSHKEMEPIFSELDTYALVHFYCQTSAGLSDTLKGQISKKRHLVLPTPDKIELKHGETYKLSMTVGRDLILIEAPVTISGEATTFDLNGRILRIQRRNHFRVDIPATVKLQAPLSAPELGVESYGSTVVNLSLGGCLLSVATDEFSFKRMSLIWGKLLSKEHSAIEFEGEIRHIKPTKNDRILLGIRFVKLDEKSEKNLKQIILDTTKYSHSL